MSENATSANLGPCLVTGAAGYLGGQLTEELRRRGCSVRALDRLPIEFEHPKLF